MNEVSYVSKCPMCDNTCSDVKNAGFFACLFTIDGLQITESGEYKNVFKKNQPAPRDRLLTFNDSDEEIV